MRDWLMDQFLIMAAVLPALAALFFVVAGLFFLCLLTIILINR